MTKCIWICVRKKNRYGSGDGYGYGRTPSKLLRPKSYTLLGLVCVPTCVRIGKRIRMYICKCICTRTDMRAHTRARIRMKAGMSPCTRPYVWFVYVYTRMYIYMYMCSKLLRLKSYPLLGLRPPKWVYRSGFIQVCSSKWVHWSEFIEVSLPKWVHRGQFIKVNLSKWVHRSEFVE